MCIRDRSVTFQGLDDGDYTFKFKASNNDGIWNESPYIISMIVTPPIWDTWYAYIFYVFLTVGIGYLSFTGLEKYRDKIDGMIHCSGGAQTKVLHFVENVHVIKDNMFELPPLFKMIQEESSTDWKEMYKVFNMGHRMEIYVPSAIADDIISISHSYNIDAQIIGRVEDSETGKKLTIRSEFGTFEY